MSRVIYVNGRYQPYANAAVHAEDRGFQFADAVYEVIEVSGGKLVDARRHLERLARSLDEISMPMPMSEGALRQVMSETLRRNRVRDGLIYIQVTRGAAPRDFAFPGPQVLQSVIILARRQARPANDALAEEGIAIMTMRDPRWARSDIKTVMLLPAVLAKAEAKRQGAREVWFTDENDAVTEGGSSNAWIVTLSGKIVTRALDNRILPGITRASAMDTARHLQLQLEERAFTLKEAYEATEAFITSATNTVMPVVCIDGRPIGCGHPGPVARQLRRAFHHIAEISAL